MALCSSPHIQCLRELASKVRSIEARPQVLGDFHVYIASTILVPSLCVGRWFLEMAFSRILVLERAIPAMLLETALAITYKINLREIPPKISNHQKKTYVIFPVMSYESERDQGEGRGKHRTCWEIQEEEGTWAV